jgi:ribonuclease VapC
MFLDASAAVAVLADEPDQNELVRKLDNAKKILVSPLAYYETCLGLARAILLGPEKAEQSVRRFFSDLSALSVPLDEAIGFEAMRAYQVFGKGRHKAQLNMGDCFAYACAKTHKVPLLCTGNDFIHTDIEIA